MLSWSQAKTQWDDKWQVRFTITQDPKTKQLAVLYEWEEKPGKPLRKQRLTGKIDGNRLRISKETEITLSSKDPDKGKAVGNFKVKRTAELVREKEKDR